MHYLLDTHVVWATENPARLGRRRFRRGDFHESAMTFHRSFGLAEPVRRSGVVRTTRLGELRVKSGT